MKHKPISAGGNVRSSTAFQRPFLLPALHQQRAVAVVAVSCTRPVLSPHCSPDLEWPSSVVTFVSQQPLQICFFLEAFMIFSFGIKCIFLKTPMIFCL